MFLAGWMVPCIPGLTPRNTAGIAIMFYGYDQGVMSQVNLNPDYQTRMGINPVTGIHGAPSESYRIR